MHGRHTCIHPDYTQEYKPYAPTLIKDKQGHRCYVYMCIQKNPAAGLAIMFTERMHPMHITCDPAGVDRRCACIVSDPIPMSLSVG